MQTAAAVRSHLDRNPLLTTLQQKEHPSCGPVVDVKVPGGSWGFLGRFLQGGSRGGPPGEVLPGDHLVGSPLGEILSYLDSLLLNVALREVGFTFWDLCMLSSTPPSLNVALREVGFTFLGFFMLS